MSSWVNRTVLSGSSVAQNGTNSHTCTFTAATAGNLLVAVVSGEVTFTTPAGWTIIKSAVNNSGIYAFSKTAGAGESSFTTTHNGSNFPILGVVYEFPSTSAVVGTAGSATGQSGTATGPSCTGLSGIYTRFAARSWAISSTSTTANATWIAPKTEDYDDFNASGAGSGIALTIAYDDDCAGPAFTPISGYAISGASAGTGEGVSFAISSTDTTPVPQFIQGKAVSSGGAADTTVSATYDWPVAAGDLLVVALSYQSTTATAALSDTLGNTYHLAAGPLTSTPLGFTNYIFYTVSQFSGTNGITATMSASAAFRRILVHEYSSVDTFDGANGAIGSDGAIDSGTVTTKSPTELIFGWGLSNNGTITAGSGFTLRQTAQSESTEDKVVNTKGSYSAGYPADGSAWLCQVAAFYSSVSDQSPATVLSWLRF